MGQYREYFHYDLEGRLAILKNKLAERRHMFKYDFEIPEDVLFFMASSIKDNVRKLEGALNRLIHSLSVSRFTNTIPANLSLE
jgi:chromosomal replication initiation ATPase DnaA